MNKKVSLVIMAAGIGSRFKGGLKQLQSVGLNNEIILDYSIYDSIKVGIDRVVFIIRKDIESDFKECIGNRISKKIKVDYVFQENLLLKDRVKPLGTGHAVLCCKDYIDGPFIVINADDYYGCNIFKKINDYLLNNNNDKEYVMAGYKLENTLSSNGAVTRGVCIEKSGYIFDIEETYGLIKKGSIASGYLKKGTNKININKSLSSIVSMNMWGLYPSIFKFLTDEFSKFLFDIKNNKINPNSEFLLPNVIKNEIKNNNIKVKIINTNDNWFGLTYKEDIDNVRHNIKKLVSSSVYPNNIY